MDMNGQDGEQSEEEKTPKQEEKAEIEEPGSTGRATRSQCYGYNFFGRDIEIDLTSPTFRSPPSTAAANPLSTRTHLNKTDSKLFKPDEFSKPCNRPIRHDEWRSDERTLHDSR